MPGGVTGSARSEGRSELPMNQVYIYEIYTYQGYKYQVQPLNLCCHAASPQLTSEMLAYRHAVQNCSSFLYFPKHYQQQWKLRLLVILGSEKSMYFDLTWMISKHPQSDFSWKFYWTSTKRGQFYFEVFATSVRTENLAELSLCHNSREDPEDGERSSMYLQESMKSHPVRLLFWI